MTRLGGGHGWGGRPLTVPEQRPRGPRLPPRSQDAEVPAATPTWRRERLRLAPQVESVPIARHFLRLQLEEWGLQAASETVELAASELVTNAVLHARTTFDLTVQALEHAGAATPAAVTVSVKDGGGPFPGRVRSFVESGPQMPDWESDGGRGFALVAAVSDDWGLVLDGAGTTAWFRVHLPSSAGT